MVPKERAIDYRLVPLSPALDVLGNCERGSISYKNFYRWIATEKIGPSVKVFPFHQMYRDQYMIENFSELLALEGFDANSGIDRNNFIRYLGELNFSPSRGRLLNQQISDLLKRDSEIPRRALPEGSPFLAQDIVDTSDKGPLPERLKVWFRDRIWLVPNPYLLLPTWYLEDMVKIRKDEVERYGKSFDLFNLSITDLLFGLDQTSNRWTKITREVVGERFLITEDSYAFIYYMATRGFDLRLLSRADIFDDDSDRFTENSNFVSICIKLLICIEIGEISKDWRLPKKIDNLNSYIYNMNSLFSEKEFDNRYTSFQESSAAWVMEYLGFISPWSYSYEFLLSNISKGVIIPKEIIAENFERESRRYAFFKNRTQYQNRLISALYKDDPESSIAMIDYIRRDSSKIAPFDSIDVDSDYQRDRVAKELGMVYPFAWMGMNKISYFIHSIHAYYQIYCNQEKSRYLTITEIKTLNRYDLLKYLRGRTDKEILDLCQVSFAYDNREDLVKIAASILNTSYDKTFFIPHVRICQNSKLHITRDEITEESGMIIGFGYSGPRSEDRAYISYSIEDLAAGFRPSGLRKDIVDYRVFKADGTYEIIKEHQALSLLLLLKRYREQMSDSEKTSLKEIEARIAYIGVLNVERTPKDKFQLEIFQEFDQTQRDAILEYLQLLFEYGMYLRRWKGPGNPFPMKASDTLSSEFDMNRNLEEPTGKLYISFQKMKTLKIEQFVVNLPMKHYINSRYNEAKAYSIGELFRDLNRQDEHSMCIRMGSTRVISSALYYIEMLFRMINVQFNISSLEQIS